MIFFLQELADEMRLHLVEFREENDFFPLVVASPQNGTVRTEEELEPNEILDFQQVVLIYRDCIFPDFFISRKTGTLKLANFLGIPGNFQDSRRLFPGKTENMVKNREFPGKRDSGNSREQALHVTF